MTERISRKDDENIYQPKLHSTRIRQIHKLAEEIDLPMTVLLDRLVTKGIMEHNEDMDTNPFEMIERVAGEVSYFTLQKTDEGWFLSFVSDDTHELENESLKDLITEATTIVFPSSSSDHPEVEESSAPPVQENQ